MRCDSNRSALWMRNQAFWVGVGMQRADTGASAGKAWTRNDRRLSCSSNYDCYPYSFKTATTAATLQESEQAEEGPTVCKKYEYWTERIARAIPRHGRRNSSSAVARFGFKAFSSCRRCVGFGFAVVQVKGDILDSLEE